MKNSFILCLCLVFVFSCKKQGDIQERPIEDKKPNVIVILLDDAGYVDFGFMGSKDLDTPHIDNLAKDGVIFTDAHVTATVCAPSRAGLITGQYQQRFGFEANDTGFGNSGDIGLADDVTTIAEVFKQNEYNTVALGKWHLGGSDSDHPNQRGFNEFFGFLGGGRSYFPIKHPNQKQMLQHNGEKINFEGYLTDVLGDYSSKFIEENKNTPFFMYLAYNAVHTPLDAKEEDLIKYQGHPRQKLAAMTWSLDENIGKLITTLKAHNLYDNTLIFFLSDNGGAHNNQSDNGQLKGWKGNKYEGGHRVPFLVSWPSKIKGNSKFNGLTSSLDIFKTSVEAANLKIDESLELDGVSLLPYLSKQEKGNPHNELYWRKLEESAIRVNNHKLISLKNYGSVLYDLNKDIKEEYNLAKIDTSTFNELSKRYYHWDLSMKDPLWVEGKNWMKVTYDIHKNLMNNEEVKRKSPYKK